MLRAEALIALVNREDIQHRRGWKPSDNPHALNVMNDLRKEVDELDEALLKRETWRLFPELGGDSKAKEEVADILVCLLQIAYRLDISVDELEKEAVRKIVLRFPGAERLNV